MQNSMLIQRQEFSEFAPSVLTQENSIKATEANLPRKATVAQLFYRTFHNFSLNEATKSRNSRKVHKKGQAGAKTVEVILGAILLIVLIILVAYLFSRQQGLELFP